MADIQQSEPNQPAPQQQPEQSSAPQQPKPAAPEPAVHIDSDKIHLTVRNRLKVLFDDDIFSLTTKNDTGTFDVLPEHANFISLINSKLIIGKLDGSKQEITINNGLLKVKDSSIHCYVDLLAPETPTTRPTSA